MPANSDLNLLHVCRTAQENSFEEKLNAMEKDLKRKASDHDDDGPKKKKKVQFSVLLSCFEALNPIFCFYHPRAQCYTPATDA